MLEIREFPISPVLTMVDPLEGDSVVGKEIWVVEAWAPRPDVLRDVRVEDPKE